MVEARRLEAAGDLQAAVSVYHEALATQEETAGFADLSLHNGLGDLYLRAGKTSDAVEAYEGAAQHCEDQQLYANGIALCKKILRNAPDHAPAYRRAARLSALSGLAAEARLHYARYRKQLSDSGRGREALESLQEIVDITADEESTVELAEAFAELGELERALETLRAVKARRQDEGRAVVILVRTIQELQQNARTDEEIENPQEGPSQREGSPQAEASPGPQTEADSIAEEALPPESFAELDTSEFGYSLVPDVEPEPVAAPEPVVAGAPEVAEFEAVPPPVVSAEPEPAREPELVVEPEPAAAFEPVMEADAVAEPEAVVEAEAIAEAEPVVESEPVVVLDPDSASTPAVDRSVVEPPTTPRYHSILEELDDEFSEDASDSASDPWESGSVSDPSLGAFGSDAAAVEGTPHAEAPVEAPVEDPMSLLLARLNVVMSEVEADGCFQQALEVIDEMLALEPGRFELLSRKLHYAFAIRDEAAAVSAYLALGESLDRNLAGFTVRTLSSTTDTGSVTAAIQVENVPGVAPGT